MRLFQISFLFMLLTSNAFSQSSSLVSTYELELLAEGDKSGQSKEILQCAKSIIKINQKRSSSGGTTHMAYNPKMNFYSFTGTMNGLPGIFILKPKKQGEEKDNEKHFIPFSDMKKGESYTIKLPNAYGSRPFVISLKEKMFYFGELKDVSKYVSNIQFNQIKRFRKVSNDFIIQTPMLSAVGSMFDDMTVNFDKQQEDNSKEYFNPGLLELKALYGCRELSKKISLKSFQLKIESTLTKFNPNWKVEEMVKRRPAGGVSGGGGGGSETESGMHQ